MPTKVRAAYWDANCFLSYINGVPDRMPVLDALLEESEKGETLQIVTSMLSISEVAFAQSEKDSKKLDPAIESALDALWSSYPAIVLVEIYEYIVTPESICAMPPRWAGA